ncbi:unnamed protein product [Arabis nemorensis]|uniref:Uncharacterized protein n=1 Tax=Arabis nemorensis TaxID=586526 RepID=A0A565CDI6_9BRAS|nr:unnamed protein product [Arabis nemorensis]
MLFAAEGGGFFSSSASGYSNGLALLLLGHKNEDKKPMRVSSSWNHYHLVVEESDTRFQLDSSKNCLSCSCTSLICFGRKSERPENPSQPQGFHSNSSVHRDRAPSVDYNTCEVANRFALKSSLKKRSFSDVVLADDDVSRNGVVDHSDRRKVQWPDTCGIEIAEVREFEPSEVGESDDEFHHGSGRSSRKPCVFIIRCSQTEGPLRRPAAPPTLREPSPPQKPVPPSSPSSSPPPPPPLPVAGDGKSVITVEFQRQKAKELQDYFKQKKLEAAGQGPFFGFQPKNEISNGRWAMFGFAVGMLTEYATGSDLVDQVKILLSNFGIIDLE